MSKAGIGEAGTDTATGHVGAGLKPAPTTMKEEYEAALLPAADDRSDNFYILHTGWDAEPRRLTGGVSHEKTRIHRWVRHRSSDTAGDDPNVPAIAFASGAAGKSRSAIHPSSWIRRLTPARSAKRDFV